MIRVFKSLHTYVLALGEPFNGLEKISLRTSLDARRATFGEGEPGLGKRKLWKPKNALAYVDAILHAPKYRTKIATREEVNVDFS